VQLKELFNLTPPEKSWAQFVDSMPPGKAPSLKDIIDRWSEMEEMFNTDRDGHKASAGMRPKENGEERLYRAWLIGMLEAEEARYLSMLSVNVDRLVMIGVVPVVQAISRLTDDQFTGQWDGGKYADYGRTVRSGIEGRKLTADDFKGGKDV
jgi:hypothetical protein